MIKFIHIYEDLIYKHKISELTLETSNESLGDIIEDFKRFLAGIGYSEEAINQYFNEEE